MASDRALNSLNEIKQALYDLPRLTRNELDKVRCSLTHLDSNQRNRYFSELLLLLGDDLVSVQAALNNNQEAIKEFDASTRASLQEVRATIETFDTASRRLTRWLIGLTVVLVVLTLAITVFTVLVWLRPN